LNPELKTSKTSKEDKKMPSLSSEP